MVGGQDMLDTEPAESGVPACCPQAGEGYNPRCIDVVVATTEFCRTVASRRVRRFDGGHVDRTSVEDQAIKEETTMRCILGLCVVLAMGISAWAAKGQRCQRG